MPYKDKEKRKMYLVVYYQTNKEKIETKALAYRKTNKKTKSLYDKLHKIPEKNRSNVSKWAKANPEKALAKSARHYARKLNAPGSGITGEQWKVIIESTNGICTYCKQWHKKLTLDHVIPLAKGGAHDSNNAVPACKSCNSSKGKKLLSEWDGPPVLRGAAANATLVPALV